MGAPANSVWLPLMLMAIIMAMATLAIAQSNETTSSPSSSTVPSTSVTPDRVVSGDLNKAARVEQMNSISDSDSSMVNDEAGVRSNSDANTMTKPTPKSTDGQYDVIDVMAATGAGTVGQPKTGQTTRIYTTGEVNDEFWLKHLGDDFKHAIHLQVGGTNEDYNRVINQTSVDGVHEEVHHEYLPGAERPAELQQRQQQQSVGSGYGYGQPNLHSHLNLDGEAMALKDNYLRQQEHQSFLSQGGYAQHDRRQQEQGGYAEHNTRQREQGGYAEHNTRQQEQQHFLAQGGYAQHNTRYNNNNNNRHSGMHDSHRHTHTHTHTHTDTHTNTHAYPTLLNTRGSKSRHSMRNRYHNPTQPGSGPSPSIINSSEDTLHAAQSQATSTSAASPSSSSPRRDDFDIPLPFKSPFNDYGSRPTRDLTYLLYKRGL
ncbi:hypothetical protein ACLKA6_009816 [Drosophila palustris]